MFGEKYTYYSNIHVFAEQGRDRFETIVSSGGVDKENGHIPPLIFVA